MTTSKVNPVWEEKTFQEISPNGKVLKFSANNSKMAITAKMLDIAKKHVTSFDLPAGYTCPAANICLAKADRKTGKITKGKHMQFLCYATKIEAIYANVRNAHWFNFDALKQAGFGNVSAMANLILGNLPDDIKVCRIHSSGDFLNPAYYEAWKLVAIARPDVIFFGYTKVFAVANDNQTTCPDNLFIVFSHGSREDKKADAVGLAQCHVTANSSIAHMLELPITCGDEDELSLADKEKVVAILDKFGLSVKSWSGHGSDFYAVIARISFAINVH